MGSVKITRHCGSQSMKSSPSQLLSLAKLGFGSLLVIFYNVSWSLALQSYYGEFIYPDRNIFTLLPRVRKPK